MRIVFFVHTPAHVHLFRNPMLELTNKGHDVRIVARDYGSTIALLQQYHFDYHIYLKATNHKALTLLQIPQYVTGEVVHTLRFAPDLLIGIGPDEPLVSFLLGKPSIIINDSEPLPFQQLVNRAFASAILTPSCFRKDLGNKHVRFAGYKELAYLHPSYFRPDPSVLIKLGLSKGEKFAILRFNVFDAIHDIGKSGFSIHDQFELVSAFEKHVRVFISPEGDLSSELEHYRLPIPYSKIHDALYYAQLLVTDTQTMTTEAAVLGTPAVRCNNFVGDNDMGNFVELEQKYDLIYSFRHPKEAMQKASELMKQPDLKQQWAVKRQRLLADKIDVTRFIVDFIENYPLSLREYRKKESQLCA